MLFGGEEGLRGFFEVYSGRVSETKDGRPDFWRTKARNAPLTHTLVLLPFPSVLGTLISR